MGSNGKQRFVERANNTLRWQHSPVPYDAANYHGFSVIALGV